jgi:hypothetical protein
VELTELGCFDANERKINPLEQAVKLAIPSRTKHSPAVSLCTVSSSSTLPDEEFLPHNQAVPHYCHAIRLQNSFAANNFRDRNHIAYGRLCCKSRFALGFKNSAGRGRGFRVEM